MDVKVQVQKKLYLKVLHTQRVIENTKKMDTLTFDF